MSASANARNGINQERPGASAVRNALLGAWAWCVRLLYEHTALVLTIMFFVTMAGAMWHLSRISIELVQSAALQGTRAGALEREIIAREMMERELRKAKNAAETANVAKSQFLTNMGHELRTPLNSVIGYMELIHDNIYGEIPEKIRDVLQRVEKNGRRLLSLINEVLDIAKMETGRLTLSLSDYSMGEIAQAVATSLETAATDKHLALKVTVAPDLPLGRGDQQRLTQVVLNLVGNAIKFTEVGEVQLDVRAADAAFVVSVADTGPGIAAADQERIFEAFGQIDTSKTRKGGTGLGLSIAKRIVKLHGGRIWLESSVGEGSTFRFTVPIRVEQQSEIT